MKRLLIVEDSSQFRKLLVDLLHGYYDKIYECTGGVDVMKAYKKFKPDCVLMDTQMKKKNAFAVTKQIKTVHPDARVVLMSPYNDPEIDVEARASGAERAVLQENLLDLKNIVSHK